MRWEQINSAHVLLVLRPVCFCHSRRECRISACCWRDSQKFMHQQASHIVLQPMYAPTPPKKKKKSLLLGVWLLASPHLQSSYTHRVGGRTGLCLLMFVFPQSRLYSHVFQCHLEDSPVFLMLRKFWIRN